MDPPESSVEEKVPETEVKVEIMDPIESEVQEVQSEQVTSVEVEEDMAVAKSQDEPQVISEKKDEDITAPSLEITQETSQLTLNDNHDTHVDNANTDNQGQLDSEEVPSSAAATAAAAVEMPSQSAPTSSDPLSSKDRHTSFDELRSYEAKRRTIYTKKLKSSSIYWRAFRDILSKSYEETERAECIVIGSVAANTAYADYLAAASQDRLDYAGKPIEEKKAKKFQGDKKQKYSKLGGGSMLWNAAIKEKDSVDSNNSRNGGSGHTSPIGFGLSSASSSNPSFDGLPEETMLTSFIECHQSMADKFKENYTFVKDVVLSKLTLLRRELEKEVNIISMLGDATMFELEKAEEDVQKAWDAYYGLASVNMNITESSSTLKKKVNAINDVWLVEMHYRMSVAYLTTIWEKCSAELSNLFASMKELECNRRLRLRELLILYMQRSERLWLSIPSMITTVTKDLVSAPTDSETIENDVQQSIRDKAQIYQRKDAAKMTTDPMNGPGLAGVAELRSGYELQSPLMSDLLGKAQVIWRKNENLMSVWKPCLAIATSDSYLHLFNVPHSSNAQTGTAPEVAFQSLVPPVRIPNEDDLRDGNYPYGTNWFQHLIPTTSIDLKCSKITFNEAMGNATFELTETLAPNQLSTLSNYTRKQKLALRFYSSQNMVDWLLFMKNYGAE